MDFLAYIYYRVTKHFLSMRNRREGSGISILAGVESLLIGLYIIMPASKAFPSLSWVAKYGIIPVFIVLLIVNFRIYNGRYQEYNKRWGNESFTTRTLKGLLVTLFLFSPLLSLWWLQYQPWF